MDETPLSAKLSFKLEILMYFQHFTWKHKNNLQKF